MERLGNILYRVCRMAAVLTTLYGGWESYWAPDNRLIVFALFLGPALLVWSIGKLVRFVLSRF